jgi:hypothetical protein
VAETGVDPAGWAWDRSGRLDGGRRAWFRTPPGCPRRSLAPGLDWLGDGGYTVVAPSVHPSGAVYTWPNGGPPEQLPEVPAAMVELLRPAAPAECAHVQRAGGAVDRTLPGGDFIARSTWRVVLEPAGWTVAGNRGPVTYWRRPGKADGVSATTGHVGADALHVFSTSAAPFEAGRSYTRFGAYAVLQHGGDLSAAAGELRRHGYGQRPNRFRASALTVGQVLARPTPVYLIDGLVVVHTVAVVVGRETVGKTFVVLGWLLSMATGHDWLGRKVEPGPVMYVAAEGADGLGPGCWPGRNSMAARVPAETDFEVWPYPVNLRDEGEVAELVEHVAERRFIAVALDTLNRSIGGGSENDPAVMGPAFEAADAIRRAHDRAAVVVIHHPREDGHFRGYKNWTGNAQTVIAARASGGALLLSTDLEHGGKQKDGRPLRLQLREVELAGPDGGPLLDSDGQPVTSCVVEPATTASVVAEVGKDLAHRAAWVALLRERREVGLAVIGKDAADFCQARGIADRTFRAIAKALVDNGQMVKVGQGAGAAYALVGP